MIIFNAAHLQRILNSYLGYSHYHRPHRSLEHDSPLRRAVEQPEQSRIIENALDYIDWRTTYKKKTGKTGGAV